MKFLGPQSPTDGSFNVRTYGAKGDGSVSDSAAIQRAIDAAAKSTVGPAPTFVAAGSVSSGTGATTSPGVPAGYAADDVFLMFVETNWDQAQAAPSGWALVDGFPVTTGTGSAGQLPNRLTVFWKRATASESAPVLADPGDHNVAQILAFRGCRKYGVPYDTTATTTDTVYDTATTAPAVTTNTANTLIVGAAAHGVDYTSITYSWANSGLTSVTGRTAVCVDAGGGGGFGVMTGVAANIGAVAASTATMQWASWTAAGTIALAPVETGGGATVVIPPGNYRLDTQLNARSLSTIIAHGAYLWSGNNNYLLVCNYSNAYGFNGGHNIEVHGGIWDGRAQDAPTDAAYNVMGFYHCSNVTIRDVSVRNVCTWHGIELNSTNGGVVDNCRFEGFLDKTSGQTRQFSEAIQIDIGSNDSTPSKNITVRGCYMGGPVDNSVCGLFGRAVGSHTDAVGSQFSGIRIQGNYVDGTIQQGIRPFAWNDSIVTGNTVINTGLDGIYADSLLSGPFRNLVISGNTVRNAANCGIKINGASGREIINAAITDNVIDNCGNGGSVPGIYPNYTQSSTISGNSVNGGANIGIALVRCDGSTVSANVCTATGHDGIRIGECNGMLVSNNRLKDCAQYGIYVLGNSSQQNAIIANFVTNAGTANAAAAGLGMYKTAGPGNTFMSNRVVKGTSGTTAANGFKSDSITGETGTGIATVVFNQFEGFGTSPSSYGAAIVDNRTNLYDDIPAVGTANSVSSSTNTQDL